VAHIGTFIKHLFKWLFILLFIGFLGLASVAWLKLEEIKKDLPDISQLANVQYQIPLSIYSSEGLLIAQYGEKKRSPVTITATPPLLIKAFLAAEDANFFEHSGVDYKGLLRAGVKLLLTGEKKQGGSTITMQVTRNFLLSREKTYIRKIKEIILALEIEKEYSKNKILELYFNKIYLGQRSYGIAAAASTYYGKELKDLNLAQLAMIAGLPKAPSAYNPITDPQRALKRRNYVLRRMQKLNYISEAEFTSANNEPITASLHSQPIELYAPYIAEMVRQTMYDRHGEEAYTLGLNVYTTVTQELQKAADKALRNTLYAYDKRHGYRSLPHPNKPDYSSDDFIKTADIYSAVVTDVNDNDITARLQNQQSITIPFKNLAWARPFKTINYIGPALKTPADLVQVNDLISVRQNDKNEWELAQIPEADAAFVALNAQNGAILALSGGYDYFHNKYNRVTQSLRQPGSGFKPIIYVTALEHGYTAASLINDAPVVVDDPDQEMEWRPENYSKKFFGPTPLRTALRKSRNLISIRLVRELGINTVLDTAQRFGFKPGQLPQGLSLALGSGEATPLQMATLFSVFANGGFLIEPYFIERIEDLNHQIIFQAQPKMACPLCDEEHPNDGNYATRVISPQIHFLMNSLLRDVVQRGTATRAKVLNRQDLAGKTGTTNDQRDAWFNGFSQGIAATAWLGFDDAKPLGRYETGGKAALPMWIDFMRVALKDKAEQELVAPEGIIKAYINPKTGLLATAGDPYATWEYFREEYAPKQYSPPPLNHGVSEEIIDEGIF
jgi:penicillin-binding protein 1A